MEFIGFIVTLVICYILTLNVLHALGLSIFLFATYHLWFVVGIGFGWIMLIYLIIGVIISSVLD